MCLYLVAILLPSKHKSSAGESSIPRLYQSAGTWADANTTFLSIGSMLIVPLVISAGHCHNVLFGVPSGAFTPSCSYTHFLQPSVSISVTQPYKQDTKPSPTCSPGDDNDVSDRKTSSINTAAIALCKKRATIDIKKRNN